MRSAKLAVCLFVLVTFATSLAFAQEKKEQHPKKATKTEQGVKSQAAEPKANQTIKAAGITEKEFLKQAAIGDAFEIQMGQLAEQNASSDTVKAFAKRMITDHSKNDDLLKGVAQTEHVALPTELDPKHINQKTALSTKKGSEFDKQYMALMVSDHEQTVAKFKHAAAGAHDPTIKKFAQDSLPVLESHLADAKTTKAQLGAPSTSKQK